MTDEIIEPEVVTYYDMKECMNWPIVKDLGFYLDVDPSTGLVLLGNWCDAQEKEFHFTEDGMDDLRNTFLEWFFDYASQEIQALSEELTETNKALSGIREIITAL